MASTSGVRWAAAAITLGTLTVHSTARPQPTTPAAAPSFDARLAAVERRVADLESVAFRRRGDHFELSVNRAKVVVGPGGDVTVHSPGTVTLASAAGGVLRLSRSMELESTTPPVGRFETEQRKRCNPPYSIDAQTGLRYHKPECLYSRE